MTLFNNIFANLEGITASEAPATGAAATDAATQQPAGGMNTMVVMLVVFAVMIFFMFRSNKKQRQQREEMLSKVAKGARVMLSGGLHGNVSEVKEKTCLVEIAQGVVVEVEKNGIINIVPAETTK